METQPILRRLPNDHYRLREHLTWAEVEQLMEAVGSRGRHKLRNQGLVLLSFRHGLRVGEAVRLRRDALMLPAASAFITRLKGTNSGMHPLQPDEVALLEELLGCYESEYVFPNERGGKLSGGAVAKLLQRALDSSGIQIKVHPHMLRHSCGYYLADLGVPTRDIQEYLGHKSITNTVIYTAANAARFNKFQWAGWG